MLVDLDTCWRRAACGSWCAVLGSGMAWYVALVLYVCEVGKDYACQSNRQALLKMLITWLSCSPV